MLLRFISHIPFTQIILTEIVPITVIIDKEPIVTKFAATPPTKTVVRKKVPSLPQIKNTHTTLSEPSNASSEQATPASPIIETPVEIAAPAVEAAPALLTVPPPSADYLLDVVRTEPKLANPYYGTGEIRWTHDNQRYTMEIEAGIDVFFTTILLYDMQSAGTIGDAGIKPSTATETRRGRSTTTTQFNYDNQTISFSADPAVIPLLPGVQDKITILMQLASIGNADPSQFQPGKEITIQVAEEKEANLHQFVVVDQETIESKLGNLTAWHIVRPPRPGVYSSRIDIWLAPALNWLPVQIRNTETNGAVTTQTIRQIKPKNAG